MRFTGRGEGSVFWDVFESEAHLGFCDDFSVDFCDTFYPACISADAGGGGFEDYLVAGYDGFSEFTVIDAHEVSLFVFVSAFGAEYDDGADLGEGFDDEYARHDWIFGPVSLEKRFVDGDVFDAFDGFRGFEVCNSIHEKEWESVGEDFHDTVDV